MVHVDKMSFDKAFAALKAGKLVSRFLWGDNQFIFIRPEDDIDVKPDI